MRKDTRLEPELFWLAYGPTVTTLAALAMVVVIAGVSLLAARAARPATPVLGTVTGFQRPHPALATVLLVVGERWASWRRLRRERHSLIGPRKSRFVTG